MSIELRKTGSKCPYCENGEIMEETENTKELVGPVVSGPGGAQQTFEGQSMVYYCSSCGLLFRFPPNKSG